MKNFTLSFTLLILALKAFSAEPPTRTVTKQPLMWTRITNTLVIDSHWYVYAEADNRVFLEPFTESQALFRLMGRYVLNNNVEFGVGGVSSLGFPNDPKASPRLLIPEWRACADMTYKQRLGKVVSLSHRYVFENRFTHNATSKELTDGYKYSFRFRYRAQFDFQLWKKKAQGLKLVVSDEILLQAGKDILYNVFDHNRAYAALNFETCKWVALEAGYLNIFQERSSGKDFYSRHIFRFSVFTKIFLPHKK